MTPEFLADVAARLAELRAQGKPALYRDIEQELLQKHGMSGPVVLDTAHGPGLGDAVAWVTGKLGIPECRSCQQRKEALNKLLHL